MSAYSSDDMESNTVDDSSRRQEAKNDLRVQVRKEIRAVNTVRALVLTSIAVACVISATTTFCVTRDYDRREFLREFDSISGTMKGMFVDAVRHKLELARKYSNSLSIVAEKSRSGPYIMLDSFEDDVRGDRVETKFAAIAWAPLLSTEEERLRFEAYANFVESTRQSETYNCFICEEGMTLGDPTEEITVPGFGTFTCGDADVLFTTDALTAAECSYTTSFTSVMCTCVPKTSNDMKTEVIVNRSIEEGIFILQDGIPVNDTGPGPYFPIWQSAPSVGGRLRLFNLYSEALYRDALIDMLTSKVTVASEWETRKGGLWDIIPSTPGYVAYFTAPVFNVSETDEIIGSFVVLSHMENLMPAYPKDSNDMVLVFENSCGQALTYSIVNQGLVTFMGEGDLHNPKFDHMMQQTEYKDFQDMVQIASLRPSNGTEHNSSKGCSYRVKIFPSEEVNNRYKTRGPLLSTLLVVIVFAFTTSLFLIYDYYVGKLQRKVMENAARSSRIVASLFPAGVRDRLLRADEDRVEREQPAKVLLQSFLATKPHAPASDCCSSKSSAEPMADLFLNTTVMFADIEGFTAWSSEREPAQVFKLLESVYQAFDAIANKLGVFKVETIGDSYVAVCGLPEPTDRHAVIMAKFAAACIKEMEQLTKSLEASLGPSTSSLAMRFGLHSGPVLAGVLRGEKARFQLFGDTINTASRIESSGEINKIHVSNSTAELLKKAGKGHWVKEREKQVTLKGKGRMNTFWVEPASRLECRIRANHVDLPIIPLSTKPGNVDETLLLSNKYAQLIDWNTDLLLRQLQKVVSRRLTTKRQKQRRRQSLSTNTVTDTRGLKFFEDKSSVMDEVTEIMAIPEFDEVVHNSTFPDLGIEVRRQLRSFVSRIASLYRDVPFHNFEHASHVSLSASKLLKRIIAPEGVDYKNDSKTRKGAKLAAKQLEKVIHDSTFGISSDPLMQLSIIFATLIHDVDHTGVANKHHVRLETEIAVRYDGKCVAEQHSVILAWKILMEDDYEELRACIYDTAEEGARFRQLVVNAVIATDIADKELQALRKNRWNKAFHESESGSMYEQSPTDDIDRKATIVFEHIIQASDVAHTMQHWKVYQRWNEHLFEEMYFAYVTGHSDEDPAPGWYHGELGFFDFYIIPLARKLAKCGIFGVSSDEYLNYALENRNEWEIKGEAIVERMLENARVKFSHVISNQDHELL